jgi:hypothetical protein
MTDEFVIIWLALGGLCYVWNLIAIKTIVTSLRKQLHQRNMETGELFHPIVILMGFLFYTSANFLALLYGFKLASAPPWVFKYVMFPSLLPALMFLYYFGKTSFKINDNGNIRLNYLMLWPVWAASVFIFPYFFLSEYLKDVSADTLLNTGLWVVSNLLAPWFLIKWVMWRKLSS